MARTMSEPVDVMVIGPGAMGCLHAALLAEAGLRVALLDHRPERAARINEQGIIVESGEETRTIPVWCTADPHELLAERLVMVLVKAYDTEDAVARAFPAIGEDASVLTLQNGLGNYERICEIVSEVRVLVGTTTTGATLLGDGHVREAGRGITQIGAPVGNPRRVRGAVGILSGAGIDVEGTPAIEDSVWAKAIVNAAINPLTALTGLRNGQLLEIPALRALLGEVTEEAAMVARRCGIFVREDISDLVEGICRQTAENRSSMLQDVSAGRRTEIDYINGEIARRASEKGAEAPLCEALTALVHGREAAGGVDCR